MNINCLLHVHSSFSYDSRTDLADIATTARRHGISCVLMSEHNNRMDDRQMAEFVRRCDELSDDELLIVPGLELAFDLNRVHLLAFGVRRYIDSVSPDSTFKSLIDSVHAAGGVAVLAHPSHRQAIARLAPADLEALDGIEIWNVKNGNRFFPTASDLRILQAIRARGRRMFGFAGVDWHHLVNFCPLVARMDVPRLEREWVLNRLKSGGFTIRGRFATVPPTGDSSAARVAMYDIASRTLVNTRRAAYRWQSRLEGRGFRTPRLLAAVARRIF